MGIPLDQPQTPAPDRPWQTICLALSALSLGVAIHIRDGLVEPRAIAWLAVALAFALAGLARIHGTSSLESFSMRHLSTVLGLGIAIEFVLQLTYRLPPAWYAGHAVWPYYALLSLGAIMAATVFASPKLARWTFPPLLALFFVTGLWVLRVGRLPRLDVWVAQRAGLDYLLHGRSPWTSTFSDVYGIPDLYAPGTVRNGIVYLGFPYPPLTVLLDLPGHLLCGDYRYTNLVAMVAAAALMGYARPGRTSKLAAILFLFTPRVFLVLRNGWTEPQVAMLLAAAVFCACRLPRAMPFALGLLLVSKQFMFCAAGPSLLLLGRGWNWTRAQRMYAKAALAGALVSVPLALWNVEAYWRANFAAAAAAKLRYDALSFLAYWANTHDWTPSASIGAVALVAVLPATALVIWRCEWSPAGFAAAVGIVFLVFFSINKFDFCNYYYFVISALCAAVAGATPAATAALSNPATVEPSQPRRLAA